MNSSYRALALLGLMLAGLWYAVGGASVDRERGPAGRQAAISPPSKKAGGANEEGRWIGIRVGSLGRGKTQWYRIENTPSGEVWVPSAPPLWAKPDKTDPLSRYLDQHRKRRKIDLTNSGR
jgi:hypothetical protein